MLSKSEQEIVNDVVVWKFCAYSFLRSIRFFEAFFYASLIQAGLSLSQIGFLKSIEQITIYILEIPSGVVSDSYGGKNALLLCFVMYFVSYILFALFNTFSQTFSILVFAVILHGGGESFRSGSHKSLIYAWLDLNHYNKYKTKVYGSVRSWGLFGQSLSCLTAPILLLYFTNSSDGENMNNYTSLFYASSLPLILDFGLLLTYKPYDLMQSAKMLKSSDNDADRSDESKKGTLCHSMFVKPFKQMFISLRFNSDLTWMLSNGTVFAAVYKCVKDFIQPLILIYFKEMYLTLYGGYTLDEKQMKNVLLGVLYCLFYIFASIATKKSAWFEKQIFNENGKKCIHFVFDFVALSFIIISVSIHMDVSSVIIGCYLCFYVLYQMRRTVYLSLLTSLMKKDQRATILSVESLLTSICVSVLAPICGLIADYTSLQIMFLIVGAAMFGMNIWFRIKI